MPFPKNSNSQISLFLCSVELKWIDVDSASINPLISVNINQPYPVQLLQSYKTQTDQK